ncbi:cupin domain-containing protein [Luteimonas sp. SDU82]|uniref:cupin domain-containing protein n=1 Tax=Luteimonas sp. SDU82 TaxID=3422592 RepID=UPI003EBE8238
MDDSAHSRIRSLRLEPHPEGGHYRRIHASSRQVEAGGRLRPAMTAIHYLLDSGERSAWHRVDADEWWHWDEGDALELLQHRQGSGLVERVVLGAGAGEVRSCVMPAGVWQSARALDRYALVTCVVAPGFDWEGFGLLDPDSALARELSRLPVVQR